MEEEHLDKEAYLDLDEDFKKERETLEKAKVDTREYKEQNELDSDIPNEKVGISVHEYIKNEQSKVVKPVKKFTIKTVSITFVCLLTGFAIMLSAFEDGSNMHERSNKTETQESQPKETPIIRIGEPVQVKNMTYVVNSVEQQKRVSNDFLYVDANETFLIIDLSITNNDNSPRNVNFTDFELKNGMKLYNPTVNEVNYLAGGPQTIFNSINPDATLTGKVFFDIHQDTANSQNLILKIKNDKEIHLNK